MTTRISSLDSGYVSGDLSVYPETVDDKGTLYQAKNNAETILKHSLTYNGKLIIVDDATAFPTSGLIRLGQKGNLAAAPELIYYGQRTSTTFGQLQRGFAGSRQTSWPGATTYVSNAVMAEHHNAVKDAILNVENYVGVETFPVNGTINFNLKQMEVRFLTPKAVFRAYPMKGPPPLTVRFQDSSCGDVSRYLWDFGDGTTSIERHPFHTYHAEGIYTVKLNIVTSTGAQGVGTKANYITVSEKETDPFWYVTPTTGSVGDTFTFVDQTDGEIIQRYWIFDDGNTETETNPDIHSTTHIYTQAGAYSPTLLIVFSDQRMKRAVLSSTIIVS